MEIVSTHQPTCRHEVGWCTKHGLLHDEDAHLRSTPPNVHRVGAPSVREGRLPTSFLSPRPLAAGLLPARYCRLIRVRSVVHGGRGAPARTPSALARASSPLMDPHPGASRAAPYHTTAGTL